MPGQRESLKFSDRRLLDGSLICGPRCAVDLTVFMDTIDEELPASFPPQDRESEA